MKPTYEELVESLESVLVHAESMLCKEFATDDLRDWPWVVRARDLIQRATKKIVSKKPVGKLGRKYRQPNN